MIDRHELLKDLQGLLRTLEADLLERSESAEVPEVPAALKAEYEKAKKAERTALNYEDWRSDYITQIAAAWVLSCVFARFLEDNQLVDPPKLAGPGGRLDRARDEHTIFFQDRERATQTDREYLLHVFGELGKLPGAMEIFGEHNPVWQPPNWLGPDAARALLRFFRRIDADTGVLVHDFTDPEWDTRFLGDLYQDLSEAARKKYALLQTPEFVEEFILDRTLDPALDEFGLEGFKMIDPACGSGHFLLGAFPRILERWQREEPRAGGRDLVQRSLHSIHGVDLNPFAVAIARFRLLFSALRACGIMRLADAPAFELNLACGDSLYHGREQQMMLHGVETDESHYFHTEDAPALRRMLRAGTYNCVVANPPYIIPKDKAANDTYRRLYRSCFKQYSLAVPFMERIGDLACPEGFTGQITASSFATSAFGRRLVQDVLPKIDLTAVIDTSKAYIPGHGTASAIVLLRSRAPVASTVRMSLGTVRDPRVPENPAEGVVWKAIVDSIDNPGSDSRYVSVRDRRRSELALHPWNLTGGGAAEVREQLENMNRGRLSDLAASAGFYQDTHADEAFVQPLRFGERLGCADAFRPHVRGRMVRDWSIRPSDTILFPYDRELRLWPEFPDQARWYWFLGLRTTLESRIDFSGHTYRNAGRRWFVYHQFPVERAKAARCLVFAATATHSNFALVEGNGFVFNRAAPVIVLTEVSDVQQHVQLLGVLNSSTACFLLRQYSRPKGTGGIGRGLTPLAYEQDRQFECSRVLGCPIPEEFPSDLSCEIQSRSEDLRRFSPHEVVTKWASPFRRARAAPTDENLRRALGIGCDKWQSTRSRLVMRQEDLDWQCYRLYGLIDEDLAYGAESFPLQLGQRAFEIVMARKMARDEMQTTWFERHGSTPITEIPVSWPKDYKRLVERRIELIETDRNIGLLERPEYKRRWNTEPWESQLERALGDWLLGRLESYFDFDGRMNDEDTPTAKLDIALTTVARLSDVARRDAQFMEVAEVYRNDPAFDLQRLVEELVADESVPLLPVLRYKPAGLRKRAEWETTWELQRAEDAIDARTKLPVDDPNHLTEIDAEALKRREVGDIPVPPKYKNSEFVSTGGTRYWALRGKLDVPKERWVSFPYCEGEDGTPVIAWAGYDHLQLARAVSAYYVDVQERRGGRDDPRLVPLLACLIELLPWLRQWHNEIDPEFGMAMGDYFEGFIQEEARQLGKTVNEVKAWQPPKKTGRRKKKG